MRMVSAAMRRKAGHIQRLLEPGSIEPVYQPIVRLTDLEPVGYEGLARFPYADGLSHLPPDVTLEAAGELGLREELESACWAAMADAGSPPAGRLLFLNASPQALAHAGLSKLADRLPSRLVIEIAERGEAEDYAALRAVLEPWVARGAAIAIAGTDAGCASLQPVVELRPSFLKLPRSLVAHIDCDANRQALVRGLGAFAREVGAGIVAEGVERPEQLQVLREAQVDYAQGWLLGRPGPPWPEAGPPPSARGARSAAGSGIVRLGGLERALMAAVSPAAACAVAVEHLRGPGLLPSVYLSQGSRLRCLAAHGYWTVYDGMPPHAGVIGRSFDTGEPALVSDVDREPGYLSLNPSVRAELAVPLRAGSAVVGVLNVEATAPLGDGPCRDAVRVADRLARRLGELGRLDRPSAGQRLARAAAEAAAMDEPAKIIAAAAEAARDVSQLETAAVVLRDRSGRPDVRLAVGVLAAAFTALDGAALGAMAGWVEDGASIRTMGDLSGKGPVAAEALRRRGARTLLVVPLRVSGRRLGFLALADRSDLVPEVETVELLELLGVQVAAQLRGLAAVEAVRDRAAFDPLTGLGHVASFRTGLTEHRAAAAERGSRLALVLADLDGLETVNHSHGHAVGDEVLRSLAALLEEAAGASGAAFRVGGDEFALIVDTDPAGEPQEVAWQLQTQARDRLGTTLSIGIAVVEEAESDDELLERADHALGEVKRRGRDGVALARRRPPSP